MLNNIINPMVLLISRNIFLMFVLQKNSPMWTLSRPINNVLCRLVCMQSGHAAQCVICNMQFSY